jgi:hypothetical protein
MEVLPPQHQSLPKQDEVPDSQPSTIGHSRKLKYESPTFAEFFPISLARRAAEDYKPPVDKDLKNLGSLEVHFAPVDGMQRPPVVMESLKPTTSNEIRIASEASKIGYLILGSMEYTRRVYKAQIEHDGQILDVALKFGIGEDDRRNLEKEDRLYNNELSQAQGLIVPYYIGLFGITVPGGLSHMGTGRDVIVTCLVLTFVGEEILSIRELSARRRYLTRSTYFEFN